MPWGERPLLEATLALQGHCWDSPTLNTATLLLLTAVLPSRVLCWEHSKVGRRWKVSHPALGRCLSMMEMLLQSPALSQQCPRPVPACSAWTVTQQDWD